jgi:hypothetical protein
MTKATTCFGRPLKHGSNELLEDVCEFAGGFANSNAGNGHPKKMKRTEKALRQ